MARLCPDTKNNPQVRSEFNELIRALGSEVAAHDVWDKNYGWPLDKTMTGADSKLFADILATVKRNNPSMGHEMARLIAIRAKSTFYTQEYLQSHNWIENNTKSLDYHGAPMTIDVGRNNGYVVKLASEHGARFTTVFLDQNGEPRFDWSLRSLRHWKAYNQLLGLKEYVHESNADVIRDHLNTLGINGGTMTFLENVFNGTDYEYALGIYKKLHGASPLSVRVDNSKGAINTPATYNPNIRQISIRPYGSDGFTAIGWDSLEAYRNNLAQDLAHETLHVLQQTFFSLYGIRNQSVNQLTEDDISRLGAGSAKAYTTYKAINPKTALQSVNRMLSVWEAPHKATIDSLKNHPQGPEFDALIEKLNNIYRFAVRQIGKSTLGDLSEYDYGYTTLMEFISEAFSNKQFATQLAAMPVPENLRHETSATNLFGAFLDAIKETIALLKSMFGISNQSVLDSLSKVVTDLYASYKVIQGNTPQQTVERVAHNRMYLNPKGVGAVPLTVYSVQTYTQEHETMGVSFTDPVSDIGILEQYFGVDFINNNLEFRPTHDIRTNRVFETVSNFKTIIYQDENTGEIMRGVAKHAAVHYALRHFVDPESRRNILDSTKSHMVYDSTIKYSAVESISDKMAEEYLAEVNRGTKKLPSIPTKNMKAAAGTGLIKQFLNWLQNLISSVSSSTYAEDFLSKLNSGTFSKAAQSFNNDSEARNLDLDEQVALELHELREELKVEEGIVDDAMLIEIYGDENRLRRATNFLHDLIWNRSILGDRINVLRPNATTEEHSNMLMSVGMHGTMLEEIERIRTDARKKYSERQAYDRWNKLPEALQDDRDAQKFYDFIQMTFLNDGVFQSMVKKTLPQLSFDEHTAEMITRMFGSDGDIRPSRMLSPMLRMHIQSTPLYNFYGFRDASGQGGVSVQKSNKRSNEYVDFAVMNDIMLSAFEFVMRDYDGSNGKTLLETVLDQLYEMALEKMPVYDSSTGHNRRVGSEWSDTVLSYLKKLNYLAIYKPIGSNTYQMQRNTGISNGLTVAYHPKELMDTYEQRPDSSLLNTLYQSAIMRRQQEREKFYNAMESYYKSMYFYPASSYTQTVDENGNVIHSLVAKHVEELDVLYNRIISSITAKSYPDGTISAELQKLAETNKNRVYAVLNNGKVISNIHKVPYLVFNESGQAEWSKTLTQDQQISVADQMFQYFGIDMPSHVSRMVISDIIYNRPSAPMQSNDLAAFLGSMFAIAMHYDDTTGNLWTKRIEAYLGRARRGAPDTVANMDDVEVLVGLDKNPDGNEFIEAAKKYRFNTLDFDIKRLASYEAKIVAQRAPNFAHLGGKRRFLYQYRHNIGHNFQVSKTGGAERTNLVRRFMRDLENINRLSTSRRKGSERRYSEYMHAIKVNPFIMMGTGTDQIIEPLLSKDGLYNIARVVYLGEYKNDYLAKHVKHITDRDLINMSLFSSFWNNIKKPNDVQQFKIAPIMFGDSSQVPVFTVRMRTRNDDLLKIARGEDGMLSVKVNETTMNQIFHQRMMFRFKMGIRSAYLWSILADTPMFDMADVSELYASTIDPKATGSTISVKASDYSHFVDALSGRLKRTQALYSTDAEGKVIVNPSVKDQMSKLGFIEGADYKIVYEKGNEILTVGDALTMEDDMLFQKERSSVAVEAVLAWTHNWYNNATDEDLAYFRRKLLARNFKNAERYFRENSYDLPNDIKTKIHGWKMDSNGSWIKLKTDDKGNPISNEFEWHPIMEAFYVMNWALIEGITNTSIGNVYQFKDAATLVKHSKAAVAMGLSPVLNTPSSLSQFTNSIVVNDEMQGDPVYRGIFSILNDVAATDGSILASPLDHLQRVASYGGEYGLARLADRSYKDAYSNVNLLNGDGHYVKASKIVINEDHFKNDRDGVMGTMKMFLSGNPVDWKKRHGSLLDGVQTDLYALFVDSMAGTNNNYWESVNNVYDHIRNVRIKYGVDLAESTISSIEYKSTNKFHKGPSNATSYAELQMNALQGNQANAPVLSRKDESGWKLILNANQSLNHQRLTNSSQARSLVGIGPQNESRIETANKVEAELVRRRHKQIDDGFKNSPGKTEAEKRDSFIRNLIIKNTTARTDINNLLRHLTNKKININIPSIYGSVVPHIASMFSDGTKFKVRGLKMVQRPDRDGIFMHNVVIDGVVRSVSQEDLDYLRKIGKVADGVATERRYLDHYRFYDAAGNDIEQQVLSENTELAKLQQQRIELTEKIWRLRSMYGGRFGKEMNDHLKKLKAIDVKLQKTREEYIAQIERIKPAEAVVPMMWFDDYAGYSTIEEFIKNHGRVSKTEMFTIAIKNGESVEYVNALDFIKDNSPDYYTDMTPGVQALMAYLHPIVGTKLENLSDETFVKQTQRGNTIQTLEDLVRYYESFAKSIQMVGTRIPSTLWGSSHAYEAASFTYDSGSIIYTSAIKSLFDGSDYDIDQLNVTFRDTVGREVGKGLIQAWDEKSDIENANEVALKNTYFDQLWFAYMDPANLGLMLTPLDLQEARKMVERRKNRDEYNKMGDIATMMRGYLAATSGKNQVAIFANTIMEFARIQHVGRTKGYEIAPWMFSAPDVSEADVAKRVEVSLTVIAELLQMSVDNVKEFLLHYLNINTVSGGILAAMAMSTVTDEEGNVVTDIESFRKHIYEFADDYFVRNIIRQAYNSQSLNEYRQDVLNVIDDERATLKIQNNPEVAEQNYQRQINYHKKRKADYEAYIAEIALPENKRKARTEQAPEQEFLEANNMFIPEDVRFDLSSEVDDVKKKKAKWAKNIIAHEKAIQQLEEMGLEAYVDKSFQRQNERAKRLEELYTYAIRGKALYEISNLFFYQGYPSTDAEIALLEERLQYIFRGLTIQQAIDGVEPVHNGWMIKHRFVGDVNDVQFNLFSKASQVDLDNFGNDLASRINQLINELEDKKRPSIEVITSGKEGLEQAISNAFGVLDTPSRVKMPFDNKYRNEYGQQIGDYASTTEEGQTGASTARFGVGVEIETDKLRSPRKVADSIVEQSDVVVTLSVADATMQPNVKHIQNAARSIKNVAFNYQDFAGATSITDSNVIDAIAQRIVNRIVAAAKNTDGRPVTVMFAADDIYDLRFPSENKYKRLIRHEQDMFNSIDFLKLVREHPVLLQQLKGFETLRKLALANQITNSSLADALRVRYLEMQKHGSWERLTRYRAFNNAIWGAVLDYHFVDMKRTGLDPRVELVDLSGKALSKVAVDTFQTYKPKLDLSKSKDRTYFSLMFPSYWMHITRDLVDNDLIRNIQRSAANALYIHNDSKATEYDVVHLKEEYERFKAQYPEHAKMLMMYAYLNAGMSYSLNVITTYLDDTFLENISETINDIVRQLENPATYKSKYNIRKMLNGFWLDNAITNDFNLGRSISNDDLQSGITPKYIISSDRINNGVFSFVIRKYMTHYADPVNEKDSALDKIPNRENYTFINNWHTGNMATVPLGESVITRDQVIKPSDPSIVDDLFNETLNSPITIRYPRGHKIDVGPIMAHGIPGWVKSKTATSIRVGRRSAKDDTTVKDSRGMPLGLVNQGRRFRAGVSRQAMESFANRFMKAYPGVTVRIVDNNSTSRPGRIGYVENGVIHYNSDLVSPGVIVHEIMHPLYHALKSSANPSHRAAYDVMYQAAESELNAMGPVASHVLTNYPELTGEDLIEEIAMHMAETINPDKVWDYVNDSKMVDSYYGKWYNAIKGLWDSILDFIRSVLGRGGVVTGERSRLDEITPYSTFGSVIEAIIGDVFEDESDIYSGLFLDGMAALQDLSKESRFGNVLEPMPTTEFIEDILLIGAGTSRYDVYKNQSLVNSLYEQVMKGNGQIELMGRTYSFRNIYDNKSLSDEQRKKDLKKSILEDLIPLYQQRSEDFKDGLRKWLNAGIGNGSTKNEILAQYFSVGKTKEGKNILMYRADKMRELKEMLGFTRDVTRVYRYSDLGNLGADNPLSRLYDSQFVGKDPLVIVHDVYKDELGKEHYEISLVDITEMPLQNSNTVGLGSNRMITSNFLSKEQSDKMGVLMNANYSNVMHLQKGMIGMNLLNRDDVVVNIRQITNIQVGRKGLTFTNMDWATLIPTLKTLGKQRDFTELMPDRVRTLLENESSYEPRKYKENYMVALRSILRANEGKAAYGMLNRVYHAYIENKLGSRELLKAIRRHQEYLRNKYDVTVTDDYSHYKSMAQVHEMRVLSHIAHALEVIHYNGVKEQHNLIQNLMHTTLNLRNEILNSTFEAVRSYQQELEGLYIKEREEFIKEFDAYFERHKLTRGSIEDYMVATSSKVFDRMFYPKKEDRNGKSYDVLMIHHDMHAKETRDALMSSDPKVRITEADVKFGAYLTGVIEKNFKRLIRADIINDSRYFDALFVKDNALKEYVLNEAALDELVNTQYEENWRKGMVPVMSKSGGESIADGKIMKGLKRMVMQQGDRSQIYEEVMGLQAELAEETKWPSKFLAQIKHAPDAMYGGGHRTDRMGVEQIDGEDYIVTNEDKNATVSHNLLRILSYHTADSLSKQFYETNVIPLLTDAHIIAASVAISSPNKTEQDLTHQYLSKKADAMIYGRRDKNYLGLGLKPEVDQKVTAALNTFLKLTTFNGVALSLTVAATSFVANATEMTLEAIASQFGGNPYNLPTMGDIAKAVKEFTVNHDKVLAVAWKNQVVEATMYELANSEKYYKNEKQLATQRNAHIGNRMTDFYFRYVGMVAKMIHDGTWDAFDNEGNYDEKKDKRFFNEQGQFKDAKARELYKWVKEDMMNDSRYDQQEDKPLITAYDRRDQKILKSYSDEFVIGAFDTNTNPMGKQFFVFNMVTQFKNFMMTKLETRLGGIMSGKTTSAEGALRKIKENPDGTYSREWLALVKEGTWVTLGKYLFGNGKSLVHSVPGINKIFETMDVTEENSSWQKWSQLDEVTRHNIVRASLDVMAFLTVLLVSIGLKPDNKDEREFAMKHARMLRAIKNGVLTTMSTAPDQLIDLATGWAIIGQVERLKNLVMGVEPMKQVSYLVPGGGTARVISDYVNTDTE